MFNTPMVINCIILKIWCDTRYTANVNLLFWYHNDTLYIAHTVDLLNWRSIQDKRNVVANVFIFSKFWCHINISSEKQHEVMSKYMLLLVTWLTVGIVMVTSSPRHCQFKKIVLNFLCFKFSPLGNIFVT